MRKWIRLTGYEFRKIFGSRIVFLLILGFMAANGWQIYQTYEKKCTLLRNDTYPEVYEEFYAAYAGEITPEKITELLAIYQPIEEKVNSRQGYPENDPDSYTGNIGTDEFFLSRLFVNEMEYDYLYQNHANEITKRAISNMEFYEKIGNLYEYRKNARIAESFLGRKIGVFAYTEMFHQYLSYDFSLIPVLILCLFGMAGVFVVEKETEMNMLLVTSRNGGIQTAAAKVAASFLFCCLVCGIFWLEDYGLFSALFHTGEAAKNPLYAMPYFQNTPLRLSIGTFCFLVAVIKTIGVWGFCTLYLLLSSLCRSTLIPFVGGIFLSVGLLFLQVTSLSSITAKCLNPAELLYGKDLFTQTRYVNFFGYPVSMYWPVIGSVIAAMLLIQGFLLWRSRGKKANRREKKGDTYDEI